MTDQKKNVSRENITISEAQDALLRSGYLLETRVESILQDEGYLAEANSAYSDPETQKSRELDVHAISAYTLDSELDTVFSVLLIECINNPQPIAFLTKEPIAPFLHAQEVRLSGLPVKVMDEKEPDMWVSLSQFTNLNSYHHYCKGRISTQFCSFAQKKNTKEWMAFHEDDHFDSFKKLSAALDHYEREHYHSWVMGNPDDETINLQIYYPVLVLQGDLLEGRPSGRSVQLKKVNHVHFRRTAIIDSKEIQYHIDVINEGYLSTFLKQVDAEVTAMTNRLLQKIEKIQAAKVLIAKNAQGPLSPSDLKRVMEF